MTGSEGMARMKVLMAELRAKPPHKVGDLAVQQVRDYESLTVSTIGGKSQPIVARKGIW